MLAETLFPAAGALITLLLFSALASLFIPKGARLPMQWDFRGRPTWTAPATAALLFTPAVAALVLGLTLFLAGARPEVARILVLQAMVFVAVHALYLVFAVWHIAARRRAE